MNSLEGQDFESLALQEEKEAVSESAPTLKDNTLREKVKKRIAQAMADIPENEQGARKLEELRWLYPEGYNVDVEYSQPLKDPALACIIGTNGVCSFAYRVKSSSNDVQFIAPDYVINKDKKKLDDTNRAEFRKDLVEHSKAWTEALQRVALTDPCVGLKMDLRLMGDRGYWVRHTASIYQNVRNEKEREACLKFLDDEVFLCPYLHDVVDSLREEVDKTREVDTASEVEQKRNVFTALSHVDRKPSVLSRFPDVSIILQDEEEEEEEKVEKDQFQLEMCYTPESGRRTPKWYVVTSVNIESCEMTVPIFAFSTTHLAIMTSPGPKDVVEINIYKMHESQRYVLSHVRRFRIKVTGLSDWPVHFPSVPCMDINEDASVIGIVINQHVVVVEQMTKCWAAYQEQEHTFTSVRVSGNSQVVAGTCYGEVFVFDAFSQTATHQIVTACPEPVFDAYIHNQRLVIQMATGVVLRKLMTSEEQEDDDDTEDELMKSYTQPVATTCKGAQLYTWSAAEMVLISSTFIEATAYPLPAKPTEPFTPKLQCCYRGIHAERDHLVVVAHNGIVRRISMHKVKEGEKINEKDYI